MVKIDDRNHIFIGRAGENAVQAVQFDITPWIDEVIQAKSDAEAAAERAEELVDTVERATPEESAAIIDAF